MIVPPAPGTFEWARQQITQAFPDEADSRAITDLVTSMWTGYCPSIHARVRYALVCHERRWSGAQARLAWAIIDALTKSLDDDIPF